MHKIICGLMMGDEGKGTMTDYYCFEMSAQWNIRFSGGPQCGHRVVNLDGTSHIFSTFGSGSFRGAKTLLTKNVLFNPQSWYNEYNILKKLIPDVGEKFHVHEDCVVITPIHILKNLIDARNNGHGSTGAGCWTTLKHSMDFPDHKITVKDLVSSKTTDELVAKIWTIAGDLGVKDDFTYIQSSIRDYIHCCFDFVRNFKVVDDLWCHRTFKNEKNIVFEGNQGLLIDADYGFRPYVTSSSCDASGAFSFINEYCAHNEREVVGVMRHYMCRHGAGPFPTEDPRISIREYNVASEFTGEMRYGHFDENMFKYSMGIIQPDVIAVTCLDQDVFNETYTMKNGYNTQKMGVSPLLDFDSNIEHEERTTKLMALGNKNIHYALKNSPNSLFYKHMAKNHGPNVNRMVWSYGPTHMDKKTEYII